MPDTPKRKVVGIYDRPEHALSKRLLPLLIVLLLIIALVLFFVLRS